MHANIKENRTRSLLSFRSLSSLTKSSIFISNLGYNSCFHSIVNYFSCAFCIHHEINSKYFCTFTFGNKYLRIIGFRRLLYSFANKLICCLLKYYIPFFISQQHYWCRLFNFWGDIGDYGFLFQRSYSTCIFNCQSFNKICQWKLSCYALTDWNLCRHVYFCRSMVLWGTWILFYGITYIWRTQSSFSTFSIYLVGKSFGICTLILPVLGYDVLRSYWRFFSFRNSYKLVFPKIRTLQIIFIQIFWISSWKCMYGKLFNGTVWIL